MEYKKYILILFIALMIIPVGIFIEHISGKPTKLTQEEQKKYDEAIEKADEHVFFGEDEKTIDTLKEAEKINPEDVQTLYRLSSAQYNAKQYEEAEKTFKKLESSERNNANYWYLRAENISNIPDNLTNIKLAVKYIENCNKKVPVNYEKAPIELETEAKIYLQEYKYYRKLRAEEQPASKNEIAAKTKFLKVIDEFKNNRYCKNDSHWITIRDDLYNQYIFFPNGNYKSPFNNAPELEKFVPTQEDYEHWQELKNNMPKKV